MKGGRTIICTIHQPREDIFSLFDMLLLMVNGRVAYLGQVKNIPRYFANIGKQIPPKKNPADVIGSVFFISSRFN
jgi:ATP-binding cassette subfamily G (WHITE) protein 8 (sterolin 2)